MSLRNDVARIRDDVIKMAAPAERHEAMIDVDKDGIVSGLQVCGPDPRWVDFPGPDEFEGLHISLMQRAPHCPHIRCFHGGELDRPRPPRPLSGLTRLVVDDHGKALVSNDDPDDVLIRFRKRTRPATGE
jgi:hypothetical protein